MSDRRRAGSGRHEQRTRTPLAGDTVHAEMAKHAANHSVRRVLALAVTAAALLALPAPASASFAKLDAAGKLVYTAVPGEANDLSVSYTSAGVVKLAEAGHLGPFPILIGGSGGCSGLAALISCQGATSDDVRTGDGDDRVAARNGNTDKISCGSGNDAVAADPQDDVAADCESVDRGSATQTAPTVTTGSGGAAPGSTPATSPPLDAGRSSLDEPSPFVNIAPPVIPAQSVSVSPSGVAAVRVVCPVEAGSCRGTVSLVMSKGVVAAAAARPKKGVTLGSAHFTARGGQKPFVQVRLNRRGRQRILRSRHTRCRIVVTTRSSQGKVVTTSRTITIRARRGKH
jgi:hypothetical protein